MTSTAHIPTDLADLRSTRTIRLGVVSFVNTVPLIDGLENLTDFALTYAPPSHLIGMLMNDEVDVALCSSIDYQMADAPMSILPCGVLACDGPTLTVRLYAKTPIEQVQQVHCDIDSHTSVALLRILLRELYGTCLQLVDYDANERTVAGEIVRWPDAMLVIGDKVVTQSPLAVRYPYQLDLGQAWREHTGLPFVFGMWMARADAEATMLRTTMQVLDRQHRRNLAAISSLIYRHAVPRGWPHDLAEEYIAHCLVYTMTDRLRDGLALFHEKAHEHGIIDACRPLTFAGSW
jgi:chorismate dehydratase